MRHNYYMKAFLSLIVSKLRSVADILENRNKNEDVDLMADIDDQRSHHFGSPEGLDKLNKFD